MFVKVMSDKEEYSKEVVAKRFDEENLISFL